MIKVLIKADSKYPIDRKRIRQLVESFLVDQGVGSDMSVGLMVVGDRKMTELNKKFMRAKGTTDVLSFPQMESGDKQMKFVEPENQDTHLGDLVVSWPQAMRQAMERNLTVDEEVEFLIQHGLLHLMGIHHD